MTTVVSGRFRARPKAAKPAALSPRPCSRRRMFGAGVVRVCCGVVIFAVTVEGKSASVGDLVGIVIVACGLHEAWGAEK